MTDCAIYIDPVVTVLDSVVHDVATGVRTTPPDAFSGGLGGLLGRVAPRFGTEGVVVLGADAARAVGMPGPDDEDAAAALIVELGRAGWSCNRVSDWTTVYTPDGPKLHVADMSRVVPAGFPLYAPDPMDMVARLRLWHELTGYAWRMSPAASGLAIMSGLDKDRVKRGGKKARPVTWKLKGREPGPADDHQGHEDDYRKRYWSRKPSPVPQYAHAMDRIRAYIAAAMLTEVSPWALEHTGRMEFDARRAGWWRVELAPWNVREMPDPAGYVDLKGPDDPKRLIRTVTTPTMSLLTQLTRESVYGGVRVLDSWTGPARDYPLRQYAGRMDDAYHLTRKVGNLMRQVDWPLLDAHDVAAVQSAVKIVGHKTFGALDDESNWVFRPHWWHSILATARANLWRKCWLVGKHTGHWPLWIEVDAVWYGSDSPDPYETAKSLQYDTPDGPAGILLDPHGLQLGRFKPKGSLRLKARS